MRARRPRRRDVRRPRRASASAGSQRLSRGSARSRPPRGARTRAAARVSRPVCRCTHRSAAAPHRHRGLGVGELLDGARRARRGGPAPRASRMPRRRRASRGSSSCWSRPAYSAASASRRSASSKRPSISVARAAVQQRLRLGAVLVQVRRPLRRTVSISLVHGRQLAELEQQRDPPGLRGHRQLHVAEPLRQRVELARSRAARARASRDPRSPGARRRGHRPASRDRPRGAPSRSPPRASASRRSAGADQ